MCVRRRRTRSSRRPSRATPGSRPGDRLAGTYGPGDWLKWAWRQLTSMRIALILLFLLALASVPGSMLPQEGTDPAGVQQYFTAHPALAPLLSHLGLFNVFAAPWFAAIYLLLFASLVGCVVPRTFRLAGSARTLPPRAPRHLTRLPQSAEYTTALAPDRAADVAAALLAGHGFRLRRPAGAEATPDGPWVSAEKGYLREAGQPAVPPGPARGAGVGRAGRPVRLQGRPAAGAGRHLRGHRRAPWMSSIRAGSSPPPTSGRSRITLNKFDASYITSGAQRGQPSAFDAHVSYTAQPGGPVRTYDIQVNRPLSVDGAKVYLIGHGYAPVFRVTDARGQVLYDQATPFISGATGNFLSEGVVKVPGAQPEQLGFSGVFVPTAVMINGVLSLGVPRRRLPGGEPDPLRRESRPEQRACRSRSTSWTPPGCSG